MFRSRAVALLGVIILLGVSFDVELWSYGRDRHVGWWAGVFSTPDHQAWDDCKPGARP